MNKTIFIFLIVIPALVYGQLPHFGDTEPTSEPDIHYYKFYNGIQMIEFDYLTAYHRRLNYLERTRPRALEWSMVLGSPPSNVYVFRNERGKIVKQYGDIDKSKLLSVQESLKIAKTHNAFGLQLGTVRRGLKTTTRYFPYYLIGREFDDISGGVGLIDSLGDVVLPQEYDVIWKNDNIFITRKGNTNELRDINLKVKFSSDEFRLQPAQFHIGFADIIKDNKKGLMDSVGKIIVPCEYDMIVGAFNDLGLARVVKKGKVGFVNTNGNLVIECMYQNAGDFKEGLLSVRLNGKWGYIDANGKTIIPHIYHNGSSFKEGVVSLAKKDGNQLLFGFIDKEGNEVIPFIYSDARDFENGTAKVEINGEWVIIDKRGSILK